MRKLPPLPFSQSGPLPRHLGQFNARARIQPAPDKADYYWLAVAVVTISCYLIVRAL